MTKEEYMDAYYVDKYLLSIIFDIDKKYYLRTPKVFTLNVLIRLKLLVQQYTENCYFSNEVKNNLYSILQDIREIKECDNYKEKVEIINEIITLLNRQKEDKSMIFYRYNMFERTYDLRYLFKYSNIQMRSITDYIHQLIQNDFTIIKTHLEETEENFDKFYVSEMGNLECYYENINFILLECPYLFENEIFYNRVMKILILNNNNNDFNKLKNKNKKKKKKQMNKIKD